MSRFNGSVARQLDLVDTTTTPTQLEHSGRPVLRLRGPDKYKVLERRRRQAQITARRVLDLIDVMERGGRGEAATVEEGK